MKINFKKIEARTSFEGAIQTFDVAKVVGNEMMYNGNLLLDIGFEDLAKAIYYSDEEVEIPARQRNTPVPCPEHQLKYAPLYWQILRKQLPN